MNLSIQQKQNDIRIWTDSFQLQHLSNCNTCVYENLTIIITSTVIFQMFLFCCNFVLLFIKYGNIQTIFNVFNEKNRLRLTVTKKSMKGRVFVLFLFEREIKSRTHTLLHSLWFWLLLLYNALLRIVHIQTPWAVWPWIFYDVLTILK